jgi:chaperonin GroEL
MVSFGMSLINDETNVTEFVRDIQHLSDEVCNRLTKRSKKVSGKTLNDVATISANNDREIGRLIADVYKMVGKDGIVTVEKSDTDETFYEVTNGIKIDRGYTSRLFINNQKNDECVLEDVYILCTDLEINSILSIENVLKPIINQNKSLLIIGTCSQNMINTLGANVVKNSLKLCNIIPPQFGYKTKELMSDIALSVGGKYFSEATGDDLSIVSLEDLGHAKRVIIGKDQTVIVRDEEVSGSVYERINELKQAMERASKKTDKDFIRDRIASLSGGVGVIYVGGGSDIEQKERYDRVEDAVCAVQSALDEGILPGGGVALADEAFHIDGDRDVDELMRFVLTAPIIQIYENGNMQVDLGEYGNNCGLDLKTGKSGNMFKLGVIDPTKVTKNALKNATSVACTILSTNAIINYKRA